MSLETVDLATPGLGWAGAPGDSVDASAAEEGLGWAGLGWLGWAGLGDPPPPEQNTL